MNVDKSTQNTQRFYSWITVLLTVFFVTFSSTAANKVKLVILHTNDTHSQIEPVEKSTLTSSDKGGYARLIGKVNKIREQEKNVLVLDAGDFSQGTPYYNFFNGRVEVEAYNRMQYDAVTLGNHEFDNGVDTLVTVLKQAKFPIVSSNYQFADPFLSQTIKPYLIIQKAGLKIGIMAININPEGLVFERHYRGVSYKDAITTAIEMSTYLKEICKCDVIISLSHIGANTASSAINDVEMAKQTKYIDVIIGGHSHTLFENYSVTNLDGKKVVVAQMGKSGLYLGRVELNLTR